MGAHPRPRSGLEQAAIAHKGVCKPTHTQSWCKLAVVWVSRVLMGVGGANGGVNPAVRGRGSGKCNWAPPSFGPLELAPSAA